MKTIIWRKNLIKDLSINIHRKMDKLKKMEIRLERIQELIKSLETSQTPDQELNISYDEGFRCGYSAGSSAGFERGKAKGAEESVQYQTGYNHARSIYNRNCQACSREANCSYGRNGFMR
jgi:hypothetical protein